MLKRPVTKTLRQVPNLASQSNAPMATVIALLQITVMLEPALLALQAFARMDLFVMSKSLQNH